MNINQDSRFAHIIKDPRFKNIPKSERKVKIDKRFQSIFSDKRFQVKYTVDKRGRPVNQSSAENFRKYYDISSDEESEISGKESEENAETLLDDYHSKEETKFKHDKQTNGDGLQSKQVETSKAKVRDSKIAKENKNKLKMKENSKIKLDNLKQKSKFDTNKFNTSWVITDNTVTKNKEKFNKTNTCDSNGLEILEPDNVLSGKEINKNFESNLEEMNLNDSSVIEVAEDDSIHRSKMTEEIKRKLRDLKVDYARGMGTLMTDSSSDEETSDEESDKDNVEHAWGEMDADAEETEEATNRIAILHMDWDRIRAADLMVLCNSFLPSDGLIKSVSIYPSEFGLERLKEEELKGPIELVEAAKEDAEIDETVDDDDDEAKEGRKYHMERLRQYQLNRLKYYYAVVEFDSPETANKVYTECDGMEYESSSTKLDLRFIPDDLTFDHEPREVITSLPDPSKYKPRYFTNTALQQGKVHLTWDETDPNRKEFTQKILTNADNVTDEDLQAYLAYSSGEDEEEDTEKNDSKKDGDDGDGDSEESAEVDKGDDDKIATYRALLASIESAEEKKKERDVEMEITWGVGLKEKTQQLVDEKLKAPQTPFEALLEKKRGKKKMKKEEKLKKKKEENKEGDGSDNLYSDDDIPSDIDMNDPYFKEELENMPKPKKKNKKQVDEEENEEEKQRKAELELLLLEEGNDDVGKSHFSLKSIQDQESGNKKKKRRKQLKKKKITKEIDNKEDDFQVNVADERFGALYSSHHFNIDPADPQFRKTKAMEAIITEKLNRRKRKDGEETIVSERPSKVMKLNPELSTLVKSVKNKMQRIPR